jgi:hypothetical protein
LSTHIVSFPDRYRVPISPYSPYIAILLESGVEGIKEHGMLNWGTETHLGSNSRWLESTARAFCLSRGIEEHGMPNSSAGAHFGDNRHSFE